jgi:hypothetical protein
MRRGFEAVERREAKSRPATSLVREALGDEAGDGGWGDDHAFVAPPRRR